MTVQRRRFLEHLVRGGTIARFPEPGSYRTPEHFDPPAVLTAHLVLAVGMMVGLHGFWLLWLSPESAEPLAGRPDRTRLLVVSPDSHPWRESPRGWSPVLFPLPTPVGFSDFAVSEDTGVGPAFASPPAPVPFLERASYFASPPSRPPGPSEPPGPAEGSQAAAATPAATPTVLEDIPWERYQGLRLHLADGLVRDDLTSIEIPGAPMLDQETPWEAIAWLEFNELGLVQHAFIETSSGNRDRDRDLLRSLYQWRLRPEAGSRRGRAHFQFFQRAETEPEQVATGS